jgi:nitrous oxide reductase accessory protein NosL
MFKYYFNVKKYTPSRRESDIKAIYVTDYYNLSLIDGFQATYVLGSDIYGPMGMELIPFAKEEEAKEFMKDHKGKSILRFKDVTVEVIKSLD